MTIPLAGAVESLDGLIQQGLVLLVDPLEPDPDLIAPLTARQAADDFSHRLDRPVQRRHVDLQLDAAAHREHFPDAERHPAGADIGRVGHLVAGPLDLRLIPDRPSRRQPDEPPGVVVLVSFGSAAEHVLPEPSAHNLLQRRKIQRRLDQIPVPIELRQAFDQAYDIIPRTQFHESVDLAVA